MIPEFTLAHAALVEHRIRTAARPEAMDRPDLAWRDPRPARRNPLRGLAIAVRRLTWQTVPA